MANRKARQGAAGDGDRPRRNQGKRRGRRRQRSPDPAPRRIPVFAWVFGILASLAALTGAGLYAWGATTRVTKSGGAVVVSEQGTSEALAELVVAGFVEDSALLRAYTRVFHRGPIVQGPHYLAADATASELLARLSRGSGRSVAEVVIPEGWTRFRVGARLEMLGVCGAAAFRAAGEDRALLEELLIRADSVEGYLFPARYDLRVDSDAGDVVRRMVATLRHRLRQLAPARRRQLAGLESDRGWSVHEVLTLASIVEREAQRPDEQGLIASVFVNRLDDEQFQPRARLQSDPTAAYGCERLGASIPSCAGYTGKVTPELLRDKANPYNTYRHAGLPPGPIANPGLGAIEAVLEPPSTRFLFFVADGRGGHHFSRSHAEHRAVVRETGR